MLNREALENEIVITLSEPEVQEKKQFIIDKIFEKHNIEPKHTIKLLNLSNQTYNKIINICSTYPYYRLGYVLHRMEVFP